MKITASGLEEVPDIGFFEGTEKLLEVWFEGNNTECDLRKIPREELDDLLQIVDAEIVSVDKNEYIDSYVLSESSMFISKNRFIIKTCGITKLLYSVEPLIRLSSTFAGMHIVNFFYSRRMYLKPEDQVGIHKCFTKEAQFLAKIIPDGVPFVIGQKESERWYLFTLDNVSNFAQSDDTTLEILMSDMDKKAMTEFTKMKNKSSSDVIKNSGIEKIMPGSRNDGCLFNPIGFSLNGLYKDAYYTIHVTPQASCSYVSFETNIKLENYNQIVNRVLDIFKPENFIVTLFSSKEAICGDAPSAFEKLNLHDYKCEDVSTQTLKNYTLAYRHYCKER